MIDRQADGKESEQNKERATGLNNLIDGKRNTHINRGEAWQLDRQ